jgi:hypothetical protein
MVDGAAHWRNTLRVSSSIGKKLSIRSSWIVTSWGCAERGDGREQLQPGASLVEEHRQYGTVDGRRRRFRHCRSHSRIAQESLQQSGGLSGAVHRCVGFDAAYEVAHDLRPVRQVRPQHVGAYQRVGKVDRRAGRDGTDQELDYRHSALVGLQQVPPAVDDDGREGPPAASI